VLNVVEGQRGKVPDRYGKSSFTSLDRVWLAMCRWAHCDILRDELGQMPSGRMLPSVRTLMQTYEVSDGTVKHALAQLREEGLIVTYAGKGSYKV